LARLNADLLGGTESALRLEDKEEGLRAREEREMRGGSFDWLGNNKSSKQS
jgi:hypothetical protein